MTDSSSCTADCGAVALSCPPPRQPEAFQMDSAAREKAALVAGRPARSAWARIEARIEAMAPNSAALDLQSVTSPAFHWAKCPQLALLDGPLAGKWLDWVPSGLVARLIFGGGGGGRVRAAPALLQYIRPRGKFSHCHPSYE
jgi:hypothetical protein